ncbi:MAG: hypothetical protein IPI90_14815 [Saprospiraceae bacterium]|nr:hypothetical protein [Candidatus Vicinibacter affinis]
MPIFNLAWHYNGMFWDGRSPTVRDQALKPKFDRWKRGEVQLTAEEERGRVLFFSEFNPGSSVKGAECFHCHGNHNFTNDDFMNNGLDIESGIADDGRSKVTGALVDKGKFKVPSLRNIAQSFPYMHDAGLKLWKRSSTITTLE